MQQVPALVRDAHRLVPLFAVQERTDVVDELLFDVVLRIDCPVRPPAAVGTFAILASVGMKTHETQVIGRALRSPRVQRLRVLHLRYVIRLDELYIYIKSSRPSAEVWHILFYATLDPRLGQIVSQRHQAIVADLLRGDRLAQESRLVRLKLLACHVAVLVHCLGEIGVVEYTGGRRAGGCCD